MIFLRVDKDGIPDDQSYYDDVGGIRFENCNSMFASKIEAIEELSHGYFDANKEFVQWLDKHVIETSPGVWGLPTCPGVLFGCGEEHYEDITPYVYSRDGYLQVFEGIWINDYNPIRKYHSTDGDQFIPVKLLYSWKIPTVFSIEKFIQLVNNEDFSTSPWSTK